MEPTRDTQATLVDLLDRVLSKGLILDADVIIHVAGIPLLGLKLKAALAGIETMLSYGIWEDWDKAQRSIATQEYRRKRDAPLTPGEKVILTVFASQWYGQGIYHSWRPGDLYITDRRVFLFKREPAEILFQSTYKSLKGMVIGEKVSISGKEVSCLCLWLDSGEVLEIHSADVSIARDAIEERMKILGLEVKSDLPLSLINETEVETNAPTGLPIIFLDMVNTIQKTERSLTQSVVR